MFPHQGGELKQQALKSVEETQGVLQQNDRLMGEVLSLLASIMRLTEGMAGVEDIHASAEGLLCDQKTLHTELAAFLEQVAELLADKLSAQAIIPAEPFLVLLSFFHHHHQSLVLTTCVDRFWCSNLLRRPSTSTISVLRWASASS